MQSFALPPDEAAPGEAVRDVAAALAAEAQRFRSFDSAEVNRPVALLELISMLEQFEVTEELVLLVVESVEQNIKVEDLFGYEKQEEVRPRHVVEEEQEEEPEAKPVLIYRLSPQSRLHFNEQGMPVAPPVGHIFFSDLNAAECFGCEIQSDRMSWDGGVSFKPGDIVIFSKSAKVEDGSFVFAQTRQGEDFSQMFMADEDHVRLRPLNAAYPEAPYRRSEVKVCYKMVMRLQRF